MSGSIIVCCGLLGKESRYTVWPDDPRCFSHVVREGVFTDRAGGEGMGWIEDLLFVCVYLGALKLGLLSLRDTSKT